jgi:hypothetical protein
LWAAKVAARDDIQHGLRTLGFERRDHRLHSDRGGVIILRILYAGRSLDLAFD